MDPASTITEQIRLNAINSSPAEIPNQIAGVAAPEMPTPEAPHTAPRLPSTCLFGVLVLARPSAREDGTMPNKTTRIFPGNEREILGNPRKARASLASKHRDRAIAAVSNNRVNEA
jgi:hypothetical protein